MTEASPLALDTPPRPATRSDDRAVWTLAAVGVVTAFFSPLIGAIVLLGAVATAWLTPTSRQTRLILTIAVGLLSLAVLAGWDFGMVNPDTPAGSPDLLPPDPAPGT